MADLKPIETFYNGYRFRSRLEARWAVFFDALGVEYEYEPEGFLLPSGRRYLPDFKVKCYGTRGGFSSPKNNHNPFDLFIEVKGQMTQEDADKIREFALGNNAREPYHCLGYGECILNQSPNSDYDDHERRWVAPCGMAICKVHGEHLPDYFTCNVLYEQAHNVPTVIDAFYGVEIENPVLIVGNIPAPDYCAQSYDLKSYERMNGIDIYPWNYETIDGDHFAAYPAAEDGCFYLDGDDSNYQTMNLDIIRDAFRKARQARFEHGETPTINRRY